jgi:insulysin
MLQAKGWGLELSGGLSTSESGFAFFTVDIELTPEGLEHTDEILGIVYQYIRMLKAEPPSVR